MVPDLGRRSHLPPLLYHSYRSLRGKLAISGAEDTRLKISSRNSTDGKMDFTTKSGYSLIVCNTTVMLRLLLGQGVFLGRRLFRHVPGLSSSSSGPYE